MSFDAQEDTGSGPGSLHRICRQMHNGGLFRRPPWGRITALDLKTGTKMWEVAHGETPDFVTNNPLLKGVKVPRTGQAGILIDYARSFVAGVLCELLRAAFHTVAEASLADRSDTPDRDSDVIAKGLVQKIGGLPV